MAMAMAALALAGFFFMAMAMAHQQPARQLDRKETPMNTVVCMNGSAESAPLAIVGNWIDESDIGFEPNEPDSYALEEALRLKEKHGGQVVALSLGPERVKQAIREALRERRTAESTLRMIILAARPAAERRRCWRPRSRRSNTTWY